MTWSLLAVKISGFLVYIDIDAIRYETVRLLRTHRDI